MNTALARRLALGDRVTWAGKNDYQPSGPGTITRITVHQVEVLWEGETARRYRRTQLHNLRHWKLFCKHKAPIPPLEPDHSPCATRGRTYRQSSHAGGRASTNMVEVLNPTVREPWQKLKEYFVN